MFYYDLEFSYTASSKDDVAAAAMHNSTIGLTYVPTNAACSDSNNSSNNSKEF